MIKKIFSLLLVLAPLASQAQLTSGEWNVFKGWTSISRYANDIWSQPFKGYRVAQTPTNIYFTVDGSLTSYNKATGEFTSFDSSNKLSDKSVVGIWYNPQGKYLFISYDSGNIDLMYDNGDMANLADIKDAILTGDKIIYDVAFDGSKAYVGTSFGIVVFDGAKKARVKMGDYGRKIVSLTFVDGKLVVNVGYDNQEIRYIDPKTSDLSKWSNFIYLTNEAFGNGMKGIGGNMAIGRYPSSSNYRPYLYKFDFQNNKVSGTRLTEDNIDYFMTKEDGRYYVSTTAGDKVYLFENDGTYTILDVSSEIQSNVIALWDNPDNAWVCGSGIAQMDITTSPATVKRNFKRPNDPTVVKPYMMDMTPSGKLLMVNLGLSRQYLNTYGMWAGQLGHVNTYDGSKFERVDPITLTTQYHGSGNWFNIYFDVLGAAEDPDDSGTYWVSHFWSGMDKLQKGEDGLWHDVLRIDHNNSPISNNGTWGKRTAVVGFDKNKDMWLMQGMVDNPSDKSVPIMMLPAEVRRSGTITTSDWKSIVIPGFNTDWHPEMLICEHSNMIFFGSGGELPARVVAYDTKGTSDTEDDTYYVWSQFIGDDGNPMHNWRIYCMSEDNDGKVWMGTQNGIFIIDNPSDATNPDMRVRMAKMESKDGSGFSTVLFDSEAVTDIDFDANNEKWIATYNSGLYHLSANCDEIYDNYTSQNSFLPDNLVYQVVCHPNGSIFASTGAGIVEYNPSRTQSADDFSEVYSYPNPVAPDYAGWISIKGLMDQSHVIIKDRTGKVYLDTVTNGGVLLWDGCDANGQRVRSGVYKVLATSDGRTPDDSDVVTKIMVVK